MAFGSIIMTNIGTRQVMKDWATNTAIDIIADVHSLTFDGAVIMIAARLRNLSLPSATSPNPADGKVPGAAAPHAPPRRGVPTDGVTQ